IFHKPRAISGSLGISPEEVELVKKLAGTYKISRLQTLGFRLQTSPLVVSFGEPSVLRQIPQNWPALCAYSDCLASQIAVLEFLKNPSPCPRSAELRGRSWGQRP
ncbi:MAG: hypothetical protein HY747_08545, partial [Elusimicrobia bacterium]|nr:hypothetical protein [Elusimicrobiota bacterium]